MSRDKKAMVLAFHSQGGEILRFNRSLLIPFVYGRPPEPTRVMEQFGDRSGEPARSILIRGPDVDVRGVIGLISGQLGSYSPSARPMRSRKRPSAGSLTSAASLPSLLMSMVQ